MQPADHQADLRTLSDEACARRAAAGSMLCFEEIVRRYQVPLLRFIGRRFSGLMDAEDVLQETFVRAYRAIGTFDADRSLRPWLFTIAYRQAASAVRADKSKRLSIAGGYSVDDVAAAPAPASMDPTDAGDLWAVARRVLTIEQSSALWLVHVEDLSVAAVAEVLGRTTTSVKTMLHRARERVRVEWDELNEAKAERVR